MPRCQSCGAIDGTSCATLSKPAADSVMRAFSKSSTARSKICCGDCRTAAAAIISINNVMGSPMQIQADQCFFVPNVKISVGQSRERAYRRRKNLCAGDGTKRIGRGGGKN